jgi:hypothetical protein
VIGFGGAALLAQQRRPGGMEQVVVVQRLGQRFDLAKGSLSAVDVSKGDGTVELDDRRGIDRCQERVERQNLGPVGVLPGRRLAMQGGDRCFDLIRARSAEGAGAFDEPYGIGDWRADPKARAPGIRGGPVVLSFAPLACRWPSFNYADEWVAGNEDIWRLYRRPAPLCPRSPFQALFPRLQAYISQSPVTSQERPTTFSRRPRRRSGGKSPSQPSSEKQAAGPYETALGRCHARRPTK